MSSERDTCRRKADEAKQRAAQSSEPFVKSAYEKVAEHWVLLARLDSLIHDETITKPPSKPGRGEVALTTSKRRGAGKMCPCPAALLGVSRLVSARP
jgi:hypothetical protein